MSERLLDSILVGGGQNSIAITERNGIRVPASISGFEAEYKALRNNVIMADYSHYTKILCEGDEAFEFLDYAVAGDVAEIRDEQALYTVMLNSEGEILCDLYILNDDDTYLILSEFCDDQTLMNALSSRRREFDVELRSITHSHAIVLFEGPYSWELVAEIYGLDVIGVPYLGFIALENDTYLFRSGKSGEFGYKVIMPGKDAQKLWHQAEKLGQRYELVKAGLDLQSIACLENPYWNPQVAARSVNTPRELQLQWMVRYDKEDFFGKNALLTAKAQPLKRKLIGLTATTEGENEVISVGNEVLCGGENIGTVVSAGFSPTLNAYIAQAFVDAEYAYTGIHAYNVQNVAGNTIAVKTCATPFFLNKSMLINPNEHSFVDPKKYRNLEEQLKKEAQW